ncbi:MAG TPA: hypothetical protein VFS09_11130 [Candidatus Eisenbacteria bacterium]|nr:hypothetical protein [Candidatus Eisenbacteria bacterium]
MPSTERSGSSPNTVIIVVVALLVVAAISIWAMSRRQPAEKRAGTTIEGSATVGDKNEDVNIKVDLPDSVTVEAH